MPVVNFSVSRDAGDENYLCMGGNCVGPNSGNASYFFSPGGTYGYSTRGSGPGSVGYRIDSSTQIGLDDRQGAGSDNDYNDLIVRITSGNAVFTGGGLFVYYDPVNISSFYATPNPVQSSGTPSYSTTLTWASTNGTSATIVSSSGESWNVAVTGSLNITNLPQSVAGSSSPATRSYTLTVSNPQSSKTSDVTVSAYNDYWWTGMPNRSFNNLDPNTQVNLNLGQISSIDMPLSISSSTSGTTFSNGGSFGNPISISNGNNITMRTTTLGFNTTIPSSGIYGSTNTKTVNVDAGPYSFTVSVTTRAPRVSEDFDFGNVVDAFPYEDIDVISNTPTEYLTTGQISVNDVDIPVEVKSNDPNVQVNVNSTGWTNLRQI